MARNVQLLLTENVENLGIVGDVVNVRLGYARNFLLPRSLATTPSEELIKSLSAKRAEAERQLAELRRARESTVNALDGFLLTLERPTNDLGVLYGAVTQSEIAELLVGLGHKNVRPRDVRLGQTIKRIGTYEVQIKFDTDLETMIKLDVKSDRKLEALEEMQAADEAARAAAAAESQAAKPAAGAAAPDAPAGAAQSGADAGKAAPTQADGKGKKDRAKA